jgi:hypothetical protein
MAVKLRKPVIFWSEPEPPMTGSRIAANSFGSLGGRVPGFYTSNFNELAMREKFGAEVEGITLLELVKVAESIKGTELADAVKQMKGKSKCLVTDEELNKGAALFASFQKLTKKYRLDAWAPGKCC